MAVTIAETSGHVTETELKSPLSPPVTMRRNDRSHSPKYALKACKQSLADHQPEGVSHATARPPTEECESTGAKPLRSTKEAASATATWAATATGTTTEPKATTAKVATDSVAGTSEVLEHPLLSKQFRSLYWPLQMGQPIKSLNFCQQQCKCNKRQLGEEAKPSPSIQMH